MLVQASGVTLDVETTAMALSATRWPGRLETVEARGTTWLLDGAHNAHGARALGRALRGQRHGCWVVAASGDRDVGALISQAVKEGAVLPELVVATQPRVGTAVPAQLTAERVRASGVAAVQCIPNVEAALDRAAMEGPVVVWGSLYMLGEARALLLGEPMDAVALSG